MIVSDHDARSRKQGRLAFPLAGLTVVAALVVTAFAPYLDRSTVLGFPFGFFLAAQGVPLVLLSLLAWFAGRQNESDDRYGD